MSRGELFAPVSVQRSSLFRHLHVDDNISTINVVCPCRESLKNRFPYETARYKLDGGGGGMWRVVSQRSRTAVVGNNDEKRRGPSYRVRKRAETDKTTDRQERNTAPKDRVIRLANDEFRVSEANRELHSPRQRNTCWWNPRLEKLFGGKI